MTPEQEHEKYKLHLRRQGFELEKELGSGLSGTVWKAHQPRLNNRTVAVKFCDTLHARRSQDIRRRFRREVELLTICNHPRIPYILTRGIIAQTNIQYFVMDFIPGETLTSFKEREGIIKPQHALKLMLPIIEALAHVHQKGIIHRDVTPRNIMICPTRGPMLIDFSIGVDSQNTIQNITQTSQRLGTSDYAAPEQLRSARDVDVRTDVYSVARILYELMTGQRLFDRESAQQRGISDDLLSVIERAMNENPMIRQTDCQELLRELSPFQTTQVVTPKKHVSRALCTNVACWDWDNWDGGIWIPKYFEDTNAAFCTDCGEALLRECPGCFGEIAETRHCGDCGSGFFTEPQCKTCKNSLSWNDWNPNHDDNECYDCRNTNQTFNDDDIPF